MFSINFVFKIDFNLHYESNVLNLKDLNSFNA